MKSSSGYRWFVVFVFFVFMLLHQADKLLIGPLTTPIMNTFGIDEAAMGIVFSGATIVAVILYPIWGYLYDHYARSKLLALASVIWGSTTWLSAIVPGTMFPLFVATRARAVRVARNSRCSHIALRGRAWYNLCSAFTTKATGHGQALPYHVAFSSSPGAGQEERLCP